MNESKQKRRIGFIGYGKVAAFLIQKVLAQGNDVGIELETRKKELLSYKSQNRDKIC